MRPTGLRNGANLTGSRAAQTTLAAVEQVLRAAAMTYVAGAASSVGYLVYLAIVGGRWIVRRPPLLAHPLKPPPAFF